MGRRAASVRGLALLVVAAVAVALLAAPAPARYVLPVDNYPPYQPQKKCAKKPKPGTVVLSNWLVSTRGGVYGGILRSCGSGGQSEHKDGRAFDWMLDATDIDDAAVAEAFLVEAFAEDEVGTAHALARRMGIMYVIWDDKIYSAWYGFAPRPYLNSGCRSRRSCSATLRHRDHMHISLGLKGARGRTSWYLEQPPVARTLLRHGTPVVD